MTNTTWDNQNAAWRLVSPSSQLQLQFEGIWFTICSKQIGFHQASTLSSHRSIKEETAGGKNNSQLALLLLLTVVEDFVSGWSKTCDFFFFFSHDYDSLIGAAWNCFPFTVNNTTFDCALPCSVSELSVTGFIRGMHPLSNSGGSRPTSVLSHSSMEVDKSLIESLAVGYSRLTQLSAGGIWEALRYLKHLYRPSKYDIALMRSLTLICWLEDKEDTPRCQMMQDARLVNAATLTCCRATTRLWFCKAVIFYILHIRPSTQRSRHPHTFLQVSEIEASETERTSREDKYIWKCAHRLAQVYGLK